MKHNIGNENVEILYLRRTTDTRPQMKLPERIENKTYKLR